MGHEHLGDQDVGPQVQLQEADPDLELSGRWAGADSRGRGGGGPGGVEAVGARLGVMAELNQDAGELELQPAGEALLPLESNAVHLGDGLCRQGKARGGKQSAQVIGALSFKTIHLPLYTQPPPPHRDEAQVRLLCVRIESHGP